jgi:hypothetical protein
MDPALCSLVRGASFELSRKGFRANRSYPLAQSVYAREAMPA